MKVIQLEDDKISVDCSFLLSPRRTVVNTINAYSWVVAERDSEFKTALLNSDIWVPDGIAIVWAAKVLKGEKIKKISLKYYCSEVVVARKALDNNKIDHDDYISIVSNSIKNFNISKAKNTTGGNYYNNMKSS